MRHRIAIRAAIGLVSSPLAVWLAYEALAPLDSPAEILLLAAVAVVMGAIGYVGGLLLFGYLKGWPLELPMRKRHWKHNP